MTIDEYRRGIPTHQDKGKTIGMLCETKECCITDDEGVVLTDKLEGLKKYTDDAYANSNLYTDTKIGELINGAPTTLDTLKEIADAMEENADVVEALDKAVGSKVDQAEYDGHADNGTIHITAEERAKWNSNSGGSADTLGGETAEAWQTKLDNIQTTSRAILSTAGWYRVAKYYCADGGANVGRNSNSFQIILRNRRSSDTNSEYHRLQVTSVYSKQSIVSLESKGYSETAIRVFTKARYTYDGNTAYLEIYYAPSVGNPLAFFVSDSGDANGNYWTAITPTLTSETVDGVTVTTTYDIPANASPVTDLDLVRFEGTETLKSSILEKALSLPDGIYEYRLGGNSYTGEDLPEDASSGYSLGHATIRVKNSANGSYTGTSVTLWGYFASPSRHFAVNYRTSSGTWLGWQIFATTADLANYLPLSGGGTVTGTFRVRQVDNGYASLNKNHSATADYGTMLKDVTADGKESYVEIDTTNKRFRYKDADGTLRDILHTGNVGSYALPISGGKVSASGAVNFSLENTSGAVVMQEFINYLGTCGYLGFQAVDKPIFRTSGGTYNDILHTGNSAKCVVVDTDPGVGASVSYADGTLIFVKE